jgi:hypothetical protein
VNKSLEVDFIALALLNQRSRSERGRAHGDAGIFERSRDGVVAQASSRQSRTCTLESFVRMTGLPVTELRLTHASVSVKFHVGVQ